MPAVELTGRGKLAYQWNGEGPETVVLVNGLVLDLHRWDRQALPMLRRGLRERCRFL